MDKTDWTDRRARAVSGARLGSAASRARPEAKDRPAATPPPAAKDHQDRKDDRAAVERKAGEASPDRPGYGAVRE